MSVNPARGHTCEYRGMRGGYRLNTHVPVCGCADGGPCACSCMRVCTCIRAYVGFCLSVSVVIVHKQHKGVFKVPEAPLLPLLPPTL